MTYRINGFDQIKAFYSAVFEQKYDIKPQHISLYIFLINQNNRNNWVEWFKCPYDLAMAGACIGNKRTYYKCLEELQEWNFLKYEKGVNNWKAPRIKLEVLKCTPTDTASVPQSEPLLPQAVPPTPTQLLPLIYKHITNKQYNLKQLTKLRECIDEYLNPEVLTNKSINIEFDVFWDLYDKKVGRKELLIKKWESLKDDDRQKIIDYIPSYKISQPEKKYRKNPATFFNNESWNDEIITNTLNQTGNNYGKSTNKSQERFDTIASLK